MIGRDLHSTPPNRNLTIYQLTVGLKKHLEGREIWLPEMMGIPDPRGHTQRKFCVQQKRNHRGVKKVPRISRDGN